MSVAHKISSTTLYVALGITVIVAGLFFFGGYVDPEAEMLEPVYTDILLNWTLALVVIGIIALLGFGLFHFFMKLKANPKSVLPSIGILFLAVLILGGSWLLGSGKPLNISGYDGTENVYFWLKLTDTFLFTIYLMFGSAILAILSSNVMKLLKK